MVYLINKICPFNRYTIYQIVYRNISKYERKVTTPSKIHASVPSNDHLIQEELLINVVKNNKIPSTEEWLKIKEDILSKGRIINLVNFDAQAVGVCIQQKNYDAGKSFIKSQGNNLNLAAVGKFMRLFYLCNENNKLKNEENFILSIYNDLKEKYPILPSISAENVIHALSVSKEWKQCLDILKNLKLTVNPSSSTYSAVVASAFNNNADEIAWNLINEMIAAERLPMPIVYKTLINKFKNSNDLLKNIENIFNFFSEHEIFPTKDVTDQILDLLKTENYSGVYTTISKKGVCQCCKKPLQEISINENEFEQLKKVFMENVIIGKNLFNKTTPEELEKFQKFISNLGTCNIVIDGLNVAFSAGNKKNNRFYAKLLANVVRHYRQKSFKILVLGRVHMYKWPKEFMDYVYSNSKVFFTQNLSQDDPFLLYATMSSGLGTNFLSRDLMRGHLYLLMDSNLKKIFRKWQQLHQYSVIFVEDNGKVHIKAPLSLLLCAQKHDEGWHIPYIDTYTNNPKNSLEPPKNWLCIRKTK